MTATACMARAGVAAAIAQAFVAKSIDEIVEAAMATIPGDSEYARVAKAVRSASIRRRPATGAPASAC